jgi:hypothetical protein
MVVASARERGNDYCFAPGSDGEVQGTTMNRLLMFIGIVVGGYIGWYVGDYFGFGLMGDFLVSALGSIVGVYVAWRVMRDYLS